MTGTPDTVPFGAWPSPLSAADVARGAATRSFPDLVGDEVWWTESRPEQQGRQVVVARGPGGTRDLVDRFSNVRTSMHEYGGRSWLAVPWQGTTALVFCEFGDQRLHLAVPGKMVTAPLTPMPATPGGLRFGELTLSPDRRAVWCVGEEHKGRQVRRALVSVPLGTGERPRELLSGSDFLASPKVSPDGRHVAWLAWDHPRMPWDGTELRVAEIGADGTVGPPLRLLGGPTEAVLQPEWVDAENLYALTDRSGWWNLVRVPLAGGEPEPLYPREEEFGEPLWTLGATTYAVLGDGRIAVTHGTAERRLALFDPATSTLTDLAPEYPVWRQIRAAGSVIVGVAAGPTTPVVVARLDTATGVLEQLTPPAETVDPAYLPVPTAETLPGPGGRDVHALVYRPTSPVAQGPAGELPPYVVFVHGGPTAQSLPVLDPLKAYFTSRGLGVLDVNYGGSTGYGRAYRERLREQWGVVDVEDAIAAVRALVDRGDADGARLAIRGGSAGGWTVLSALTRTDVFAAGASYYGVAELLRFAAETHDFESRYLDGLIGPLPEAHDRYVERAPLTRVDDVQCPVLLLQGSADAVVPPSQSELFRDALARKGIPHAYLLFEGEQHGFRQAATIITALEAELSFYGQVLGFTPPEIPVLELTRP